MSADWEPGALLQPIRGDLPCGESLEDTALLGAFDAYQLFGQSSLEPPVLEAGEKPRKDPIKNRPPDWPEIKTKALQALGQSKDLRLLAHLGTALLRTDGLPAFAETLTIASKWLDTYWNEVYPLVDAGATQRQNALNCFADPVAVVDGLRRLPLVSDRHLGRFSLRDFEIATKQLTPRKADLPVDEAKVNAAFGAMALEELIALHQSVKDALEALRLIDVKMREAEGIEAGPTFDPLSLQLLKVDSLLRDQIKKRPDGQAVEDGPAVADAASAAAAMPTAASAPLGAITSRADAVRALDAVSAFFQQTEPSSPVPLLLARAKRLVSKSFLEVLADLAPGAVEQARAAGGIKDVE